MEPLSEPRISKPQCNSTSHLSFVTIATLGYGDIMPRLPVTQTLAILEAVIGQFYMAGLIAWLVSVHSSSGKRG